jgi:hypothetical protein
MAQLVARLVRNEKVGGSNPPRSTDTQARREKPGSGRAFFFHPSATGGRMDDDAAEQDAERWLVVDGRRWRRTDPALPEDLVAGLKSHLGRGRSAVGVARRAGDEDATAAARVRVGLAKHGLGERGPKWWESEPAERIARAREALDELEGLAD